MHADDKEKDKIKNYNFFTEFRKQYRIMMYADFID
jgi:hypothetical protein|tara:strand:- start:341 stop:445 length:105 start_codon:yes stop_codon:yes gene_type:complete